jgi:hypothetical protein
LLGQKHAAAPTASAIRPPRRVKTARNPTSHCKKFHQIGRTEPDQIRDMSSGGATLSSSGLT